MKKQSFFKLSNQHDLTLFLIEKELRGTKLINGLEAIGFDASFLHPDLGVVILSLIGIENRTDKIWKQYHLVIKHATAQIELLENEANTSIIFSVYMELKQIHEKY